MDVPVSLLADASTQFVRFERPVVMPGRTKERRHGRRERLGTELIGNCEHKPFGK
jgi:hypothetical protein